MLVQPNKLNTGKQSGYNYSEEAEKALMELVFPGTHYTITEGYNPRYDAMLPNGTKIEIKFTNSSKLFVEESYFNGKPSGISLSEADYYLVVQKGFYGNGGGEIGKVKLIPTDDLIFVREQCITKEYEPSNTSPGSRGFVVDRELGEFDGWLGNVSYSNEGYDISKWMYKRR